MPTTARLFANYVNFLKRFKWLVILVWIGALVVGLFFFQKFMRNTTSALSAPSGSDADKAADALDAKFPGTSNIVDLLVVIKSRHGQSVINPTIESWAKNFSTTIRAGSEDQKRALVGDPQDFWSVDQTGLHTLARLVVSNDETSTFISLSVNNTNNDDANRFLDFATKTVHDQRKSVSNDYRIELTGELAFFEDIRNGVDKDLAKVDGISLPVALLVLAYVLRSLRLLIMPLLSILVSVLLSFTLMYPISFAIDVISVTPSLMMSTTVALSIDYSLFLFSRFLEEVRAGKDAPAAIEKSLQTAGETILVSGTTLCICFLGLTILPLTLLQTMGLGAGCAVLCAMLNSLNLVPALVFAFPNFFANAPRNDIKAAYQAIRRCFGSRDSDMDSYRHLASARVTLHPHEELKRSRWYRATVFTIRFRIPIFLVLLLSMAPFFYLTLQMKTSSQLTLSVPRGVESVDAFDTVGDDFGKGTLEPYIVLMTARSEANQTGDVLSETFFAQANSFISEMLKLDNTNPRGLLGVYFFNNSLVSFEQYQNATQSMTTEYDLTLFALTAKLTNNKDAAKLQVVLPIDPSSPDGKHWLKQTRDLVKSKDWGMDIYIANGAAVVLDSIELVYHYLPMQFGVTAAVVFVLLLAAFRSVVVPCRAIFSIALTLAWSYGVAMLVYNDSLLNWMNWPSVAKYDGISWFTPVMCFSVLTGFGLDYDIFLLTRIAEFRTHGFKEHAAIALGVHKTGGIITAAGCIMAIAFAGLLFSDMAILNMCAFFIVFSVLFDTFVVRTVMVPAVMALLGPLNFWPRSLPAATRDAEHLSPESDHL